MAVNPTTLRTRAFRARERAKEERARGVGGLPEEELARFAQEPGYFIESCLHVRHIDGGRQVPFKMLPGQRIVNQVVEEKLAGGEPVRLAVLKSRRQTISSYCEALGYWMTSNRPFTEGLVLAHKQEVTEEIFTLVDGFYLTDERRAFGCRPGTENSNRRELRFGNPDKRLRDADPGLQSGLRVTSADAKEPGRAGTYHFVHGSEVAYWKSDEVWQSVGIALTYAPGTIAVLETTANGRAGLFYETYQGAAKGWGASDGKKRGTNEFTAIFLAWWMDPKNRLAMDEEDLARFDYVSGEERRLAERWKLEPEQVMWRRATMASPICFKAGMSREDVFKQEYPSDDEEAFLSSGRHFFLQGAVKALEEGPRGARPPAFVGEVVQDGEPLEKRGPHNRLPVKPKLVADADGCLKVWADPVREHPYLVVVDPAEGTGAGDDAVIYVLDRVAFAWVACWAGGHVSARELAWKACLLGWRYNTALVAIEHNNHGIATIEEARRLVYPMLWQHIDVTRPGSDPTEKVGWVTSEASRQYALLQLESEIRAGLMDMPDAEFYEQTRDFVWPERKPGEVVAQSNKPRARAGKKDDRILCAAIGLAVHMNAGLARSKKPLAPAPGEQLHPEPMEASFAGAMKAKERRRINARGKGFWGGSHGR